MSEDRDLLLFKDLDDSELNRVQAIAERREYSAGEVILRQGQPADAIYSVLEGAVRVTAIMADEDEVVGRDEEVLVRLKPGDFFGELSFVDGSVPSLSVIAENGAVLSAVPHEKLRELLDSDGPLCRKVLISMMKILASRLRDTDRELVLSRYFIRGA